MDDQAEPGSPAGEQPDDAEEPEASRPPAPANGPVRRPLGSDRAPRPVQRRALEPRSVVRPGSRVGSQRVVLPRGRSFLRIIAPGHWRAMPEADSAALRPFD